MNKELLDYFNGDELASNVWQNKYEQEGDVTPDDMHKRMAREFARIEIQHHTQPGWRKHVEGLSEYGKARKTLYEEDIYNLFKDFKYIIPQGSIMAQLGSKFIGSLSNCFVIGQPEDSYGGIMLKDQEQVQLMKRRGGVGQDISTLRPSGTSTTNAARTSTGATSFMHRFSNSTREVAQNGRRGALMLSMDINHPDVLEFIRIKRDLTQVTGANISVKLNDEFMEAVKNDGDFFLKYPCDITFFGGTLEEFPYNKLIQWGNIYIKRIKAKEYWNEIIKSAHNVAEPGLMFWNAMVGYSPDGVYPQFKPITTNPCSEIGMQPYDACRLIAVNLFSFVDDPFTNKSKFNLKKFYEVNYEAMRISDDLCDLELEHIERILEKIKNDPEDEETKRVEFNLWTKIYNTAKSSRRTGLGFTALGDMLAALGIKYDSAHALAVIEEIMSSKMRSELDCTIDLAILRGPFEGWDSDKEWIPDGHGGVGLNSFYEFLSTEFPEQFDRMLKYGRRNVSWSCVAPTGTVSLMTQSTSGIEPLFQPFYTRRKKVNPGEDVRVDFVDQNGDSWQEFPVLHPKFKDWILLQPQREGFIWKDLTKEQLQSWFEKSPWYGSTANDINWEERVKIQSVIQKYITHSISSTINLPNDVSEETVSEIYLKSWELGIKGITVYREGSRSGVLVSNTKREEFEYINAKKRPKELDAESHVTNVQGEKYTVIVGLMDNKPYEVFAYKGDGGNYRGKVVKKKRGHYVFLNGKEIDITNNLDDEQEAITRGYSWGLRHGGDIKFAVEQLQKTKEGRLFSFGRALARVLKKYIPEGTKSTMTCNECGGNHVIFQEGCYNCKDCGSSKCG